MRDVATLLVTALLCLHSSTTRMVPTDCATVKPIDPKFHSAMPILQPDSTVRYALRVVPVLSCKP